MSSSRQLIGTRIVHSSSNKKQLHRFDEIAVCLANGGLRRGIHQSKHRLLSNCCFLFHYSYECKHSTCPEKENTTHNFMDGVWIFAVTTRLFIRQAADSRTTNWPFLLKQKPIAVQLSFYFPIVLMQTSLHRTSGK